MAQQTARRAPTKVTQPPAASPFSPWAGWLTGALALIGFGIAAYLTYVHFTNPAQLSCPATGHVDCLKVTTSSQSEIFGHIPVAVTGLAYFFGMLLLVNPWAWSARAPQWVSPLRIAGVVSGVGMVAYLVFVEAVQLHAICLWCTGVHVVTFLLFLAVLSAYLLRPIDEY
jgi:uncharacterized membrane protein